MKPVKKTIALLIRNPAEPAQILAVRRARDDPEHPGLWGLPAGSFQGGESTLDLIRRIGEDKLGVGLAPMQVVRSGEQERETYVLQMDLWEVRITSGVPCAQTGASPGVSYYECAEWAPPEILTEGRSKGSLCCRLGLDACGDDCDMA